MDEHIEAAGAPVALTVTGPSIARTGMAAVWRVEVRDTLGLAIPGFAVVAQLGHGAGRPYRGVTDAEGAVEFEFTFSAPSPAIEIQFAAATEFARADRFPDHEHRESVTCAVTTAEMAEIVDMTTENPGRGHRPSLVRSGAAASTQD